MAKAKISNLKKGTHKGRRTKTGKPSFSGINHPGGISATGLKSTGREVAPVMTRISPTPHGPEPHWPAG